MYYLDVKIRPSDKTMGKTKRKKWFSDKQGEKKRQAPHKLSILLPPHAHTHRQARIKIKVNYFLWQDPTLLSRDNAPKNTCAMLHTFAAMDIKTKPSLDEVIEVNGQSGGLPGPVLYTFI